MRFKRNENVAQIELNILVEGVLLATSHRAVDRHLLAYQSLCAPQILHHALDKALRGMLATLEEER